MHGSIQYGFRNNTSAIDIQLMTKCLSLYRFLEQLIQRLTIGADRHLEPQLTVIEQILVEIAQQFLPAIGLVLQVDPDIGREHVMAQ